MKRKMNFELGKSRVSKTRNLSPRQLRYLAARAEGKNKEDSKIAAGYSPNVSTQAIENKPSLKVALLEMMESKGVTSDFLAQKLKNGMNSKKVQLVTFEGEITDSRELEDNETQHKYFRDALEIRGDIADTSSMQVNLGLIAIPQKVGNEKWNEATECQNEETGRD